jgi:Rieske Fe-S protein
LLQACAAGAAVAVLPAGCFTAGEVRHGSGDAGGDATGDDGGGDGGDDGGGDAADDAMDAGCTPTCTTGPKVVALSLGDPKFAALNQVGKGIVFEHKGYADPTCGQDFIIVVQESAGNYVAFGASCPHACCTVTYQAGSKEFVCPCHGSVFGLDGKPTPDSPAFPVALQKLQVCHDACAVYVTI